VGGKATGHRPGSGGKRAGSGRKHGAVTKRLRAEIAEAAAKGKTPLEYVLSVMNDEGADILRRDWAAETAMGYMHPRLAMVATTPIGSDQTGQINKFTVEIVVPAGYDAAGNRLIEHDVHETPDSIEPDTLN
jgi:hypothetical protein